MTDVVPWEDLTPQARLALKDELDRLLAQAPNQPGARLAWEAAMQRPELAPYILADVRKHFEDDGRTLRKP